MRTPRDQQKMSVNFAEVETPMDEGHSDDLMELLLDAVMKEADCGNAERPDVSGSDAGGVSNCE